MVGFTKHLYRFTGAKADVWFNLLLKYHEGIDVRVDADDLVFAGKLDRVLIDRIPKDCENYQVKTERCWAGCSMVRAMPAYARPTEEERQVIAGVSNPKAADIARCIDHVLDGRLRMGDREIFIMQKFRQPATTFEDLLCAARLLQNTEEITRVYASRQDFQITLVVKDCYPILVTKSKACDGHLYTFDLDDGVVDTSYGHDIRETKWSKDATAWIRRFIETNGESWNDPVLISDC
jgi:hypothetical protein